MCLQEEPSVRPLIGDVVAALSFLAVPQPITTPPPPANSPPSEQKMVYEIETSQSQPPHSDDSARYDGRISEDSESSHSEDESGSDHQNEGSCHEFSVEEKDYSSRYSERESEPRDSRGQSFDTSEEQLTYTSDSDNSGGGNTNYDDAETTELEERSVDSIANYSLYSARSTDSSMKSDAGYKSSLHGSSRTSSPTKVNNGSRRRKPVVTFKEPSLSAKRNGTRRPEGEHSSSDNNNNQTTLPAATDGKQQQEQQQQLSSSSSNSEVSSESEDEKGSPRPEEDTQIPSQNNGNQEEAISSPDSFDNCHRVFEQNRKENPQLRHLKTR